MQSNVLEYFETGALVSSPDKTALVDGQSRHTFAELALRAKNIAAAILVRSEAMNRPIAVFLPKCAYTVMANLGILYSANCYANLDIKSPPERLKAILNNLQAELVITSANLAPALYEAGVPAERLLLVEEVDGTMPQWDEASLAARRAQLIDTDPLCIIHTSGSTGMPKGVALHHKSTIDFMDWAFERLGLGGEETIGSLSPFYFDIYTLELWLSLAKGATLVILPEQYAAFPAKLLEYLVQEAVSFIFWVPTIMVNIANQGLLEKIPQPALRKVLFAGEVFPTKPLNYWRRQLPQALFVNLYGPIEITVDCTYFIVDREMADDEKLPIGFPCRNTDVLIIHEDNRPARVNEHGELCIRGSSLALGYWNSPERTAQAFVQNPLHSQYPELVYRTGDLVYRNERGEIMFVGRKDYQIKHQGYRIELGEIEHAALQVRGVRHACVVYDASSKDIVLYFESEEDIAAADLRRQLGQHLPKYMLPTVTERVGQMPRNPNGKIDRLALSAGRHA
ncbi:amino acid adenylation domain-containing protein [Herbaspirillum sp. RU 5E]|uniref:amino acid adenylation domain-containing protein n=1 Tax=Herbaspirillum sp. CAH-3 TaxID=2605746 RepID=UPI0012AC81C3|nr:amino acid adenylation domain-containing protein [Herbaspirillum sp. CAH-3]MBW9332826.1 amino acid adenylation domain-containing protein [Herbaspirillum sp. RU 5E]MRT30638.1 amino acid adenylation domain-containing protein [Herbaspirillum sp. CAH-3]